MQSFFDLSDEQRFKVYDAIEALNCKTHNCGATGCLNVAVAKGQYGALSVSLEALGLFNCDLYKFPLGTDKPPMHLRHDSNGIPDSCWLFASFKPH